MADLHLISEHDELSTRNGSAILSVAKELQKAAIESGKESWIGGGSGKLVDLVGSVEVIRPRNTPLHVRRAMSSFSSVSKYLLGTSLTSGLIPEAIVDDVDNVFCHNQPWLQHAARKAYPRAKIHLYVHNRIMIGAPSRVIRRVLSGFDSVITVSDYVASELLSRAKPRGANPGLPPFHTIFNGVDPSRFLANSDAARPVDVVYVGRIVPEKGAHVLALAMAEIVKSRRCSLRIVGGASFLPTGRLSPYEQNVLDTLGSAGVSYEHTGPLPPSKVPALINSSRLMVIPSVWDDPCPLAFLEGLASDASVIASHVGGMPEVGPNAGAIFVEPKDPAALAREMTRVLDNSDLERDLAKTGQRWAATRTWSAVYDQLSEAVC